MDPCRPVMALGLSSPLSGHHGSSDLRTPRSKRIEPFDQDASTHQLDHRPSPRVEKRPSLSTMQFGSVMPSAELFSVTLSSTPTASTILETPRATARLVPSPPSAFLASLRSKTLLDYDFMREFSLAKRKPVQDRNLSKISASSVYSMRMAQIHLEQQAQCLQKLQLPASPPTTGSKSEGKTRTATETSGSGSAPLSARLKPPLAFRRSLTVKPRDANRPETGHEEASSCFPTLWRPADAIESGQREIVKLKYRQPEPPSPALEHSTDQNQSQPRRSRRHTRDSPATPTGSLISDGLSEFDLRKCHPASSVTAIHGFLQEQDVAALLEETGYGRTELYALWGRFKALCAIAKSPKGIDKETFRRGIPQLSVEDQFFIDRVFDILDADGSGILEWQEFVEALSALEKGDVAKRVGFLFRVYDLNGDGESIHRDEVMRFFLTSLLIETTDELIDVAKHFVGKIFDAVGCGDQDTMKIEDALRYMSEHPSADIYSLFGRTMVTKQRMTSVAAVVESRPGSFRSRTAHITNSE